MYDVTLNVIDSGDGDRIRQFPSHKSILALRSSVFRAMFTNGAFKEANANTVDIEECSPQAFQILEEVFVLADRYDVDRLKAALTWSA